MVVSLSSLQRINVQLFSLCFLRFSILSFSQLHLVSCKISNIDIKQIMRYFQFMVGNMCCSVLDTYMPELSTDQDWIGLKPFLAGSGLDRTAIFMKIGGSGLDRTEKIFDVFM